jgi:hypothetical protein
MYHPSIVNAKIDAALKSKFISQPPEYHTRAEVDQANRHLDSTREFDPESGRVKIIRPFTPDEIEWMRNERFLCRNDFDYFESRYIWVKNAHDQVVQFANWVSQSIFMDIIREMEFEQIAIMIQELKARQLGISRKCSNLILHRTIFFPHVNAVIGSSTPAKTLKLLDMLEFPLDRLPFWLVPDITARRRDGEGGFLEFGKMDTGITLQHGSQMSGIARGSTPTICHLTEMAEFDHAESLVDASLLRAMHDHPRTMLILEGTGEGYNWWYRKWQSAKQGWPTRQSRLRPSFLPWFTGSDLYPTPAWLRAHPIPPSYTPIPYVIEHSRKAAEYVQSNDLLLKYLGSNWELPPEQQWFYECEYSQAMRESRLHTFLQEMPANDDEAFQTSNLSVFEAEVITNHQSRVRNPVGVYGLIGPSDEVPYRLQPHATQIDRSKAPINVIANWNPSRPAIRYQLVPLRWEGYPTDSGQDRIYIYEHPIPGETYGLGVDTSYGVGKDRSTIEVAKKGSPWQVARQVAEFCSDKINAMDAVPFCMALSTYYSPPGNSADAVVNQVMGGLSDLPRQCRVAIECKGNGDQTQLQMRFRGWSNFHRWQRIDGKKIDQAAFTKIGVYTNEWFRAGLMEWMIKMLRDNELEIFSPFFIQEMAGLEASMDRQKIAAANGQHDDRFMSMGFIILSLYQWEKDRPVSLTRHIPNKPQAPVSYARLSRNIQEVPFGIE